MQSGLRCVTLCVILAIALCYDSEESNESFEDVFLKPYTANSFMRTPRRNFNSYRWSVKSPAERHSEMCEEDRQCRSMARRYGTQFAYQRFFNTRRNNRFRY